jgi:glutathione S-transferase
MSEKGLSWEQTDINLRKGEQFKPEYLKLNPKAVVPTLIHEGNVLRESTVIINYLEDVFDEPDLKPDTAYARAMMNLIIKSFDEEVHPSVGVLSYAIVLRHQMNTLKSPEEMERHFQQIVDPMRRQRQQSTHHEGLNAPVAGQSVNTLRKVVKLLDDIKGTNKWLCGDNFSLADASAAPYMTRIKNIGLAPLWESKPGIEEWLNRVTDRVLGYELKDPWGSESFHRMVAGYVEDSRGEIERLQDSLSA